MKFSDRAKLRLIGRRNTTASTEEEGSKMKVKLLLLVTFSIFSLSNSVYAQILENSNIGIYRNRTSGFSPSENALQTENLTAGEVMGNAVATDLSLQLGSQTNSTVAFSATLTRFDDGAPIPRKNITFYQDGTSIANGKTNQAGVASKSWKPLPGPHTVYARFEGDTSFAARESNSVSYTYWPPPKPIKFALPDPLPPARQGANYQYQCPTPTGGDGGPWSFELGTMGGFPPMNVTLCPTSGLLSGLVTSPVGQYNFTICVVDVAHNQLCKQTSIQVKPAPNSSITWVVSDQCNNGYSIDYKFYDFANNWVWPGASTYYYENYNDTYKSTLACLAGSKVCIGANSGSWYWGVGLDGTHSCSNCCYYCDGGTHSYAFGCGSPPPPNGSGQCTGLNEGPNACGPCNTDADCPAGDYCWKNNPPAPFCH